MVNMNNSDFMNLNTNLHISLTQPVPQSRDPERVVKKW